MAALTARLRALVGESVEVMAMAAQRRRRENVRHPPRPNHNVTIRPRRGPKMPL